MTFQTVPVDIVGQSYEHRSRALSSQVTMNMIPEFVLSGRSQTALTNWPGTKSFSTSAFLNDRGMHVMSGTLFKISGTTLESISSTGVRTTIGTIAGSNYCVFADDGTTMRIATGSKDYIYDGVTLSEITDPDLNPGNSVSYINQQMVNDSNGGQFQVSDVGVPGSIDPLNFATAESSPDDTIRVFTFSERLYLFGDTDSVETWWNSGSGNPPFDRVNGGTMNVGLKAIHSVDETPNFVYFLGSDSIVYRFSSHQLEPVSSPAISRAFENMTTASDAVAYTVSFEGQYFYIIRFNADNRTFAFNESGNAWFELSVGADQSNYSATSYVEAYGKKLMGIGASVVEFDPDTYTHNGDTMIRERVTAPISDPSGARILMNRFEVVAEVGVGLISGQGVDPLMMFQASYDGGESWSDEDWISMGRMSQGRIKIEWYNMASAYEIMVRVRVSDPVFVSIHSAAIDIQKGGW